MMFNTSINLKMHRDPRIREARGARMIRFSHGLSAVTATTICVRTASLLPSRGGGPGVPPRAGPAGKLKLRSTSGCRCA